MKRDIKKNIILIITYIALIIFVLVNFEKILSILGYIINIFSPFIFGVIVAFVLNVLVNFIERKLFGKVKKKTWLKIKRPLSIGISVVLFIFIIVSVFLDKEVQENLINICFRFINHRNYLIRSLVFYLLSLINFE